MATKSKEKNLKNMVHTVSSVETLNATKTFDDWLMRLENTINLSGVPVQEKTQHLLHHIAYEAYDVICDEISPDKPETKSYEELIAVLKNHYASKPAVKIVGSLEFLRRKQRKDETAQDYFEALEQLAVTTCRFGEYLEKALRNQFIFGVISTKVKSRLLEYEDLPIKEAVKIAMDMEKERELKVLLRKVHVL